MNSRSLPTWRSTAKMFLPVASCLSWVLAFRSASERKKRPLVCSVSASLLGLGLGLGLGVGLGLGLGLGLGIGLGLGLELP